MQPHPQVVGQHLPVRAHLDIGRPPAGSVEHGGMDEAQRGLAPVLALVIIGGAGNLRRQVGLGVVVKPQHSGFHGSFLLKRLSTLLLSPITRRLE